MVSFFKPGLACVIRLLEFDLLGRSSGDLKNLLVLQTVVLNELQLIGKGWAGM